MTICKKCNKKFKKSSYESRSKMCEKCWFSVIKKRGKESKHEHKTSYGDHKIMNLGIIRASGHHTQMLERRNREILKLKKQLDAQTKRVNLLLDENIYLRNKK